jgi:putative membrane protein
LLDLTGAISFLELESYPAAADDAVWLEGLAIERFGVEVAHWIDVYRRYYGFYFSSAFDYDPRLYAWCLRQLNR